MFLSVRHQRQRWALFHGVRTATWVPYTRIEVYTMIHDLRPAKQNHTKPSRIRYSIVYCICSLYGKRYILNFEASWKFFFLYGYPFALETLVLEAAGSSKGVPARFP